MHIEGTKSTLITTAPVLKPACLWSCYCLLDRKQCDVTNRNVDYYAFLGSTVLVNISRFFRARLLCRTFESNCVVEWWPAEKLASPANEKIMVWAMSDIRCYLTFVSAFRCTLNKREQAPNGDLNIILARKFFKDFFDDHTEGIISWHTGVCFKPLSD